MSLSKTNYTNMYLSKDKCCRMFFSNNPSEQNKNRLFYLDLHSSITHHGIALSLVVYSYFYRHKTLSLQSQFVMICTIQKTNAFDCFSLIFFLKKVLCDYFTLNFTIPSPVLALQCLRLNISKDSKHSYRAINI